MPIVITYELHPLATLFPQITGEAFDELVADIKANGLREAITLLDGKILDGRNRASACHAAGVEPRFEEWKPASDADTPQAFVVSRNLRRRHLKESERAMIGARLVSNPFGKKTPKTTAGQAATALNVSIGQVQRARRVISKGTPELVEKVDRGELTVRGASAIAAKLPEEQRAILAAPKPPKPVREPQPPKPRPSISKDDAPIGPTPAYAIERADKSEQREFDEVIRQLDDVTDRLSMWPRFIAAIPMERRKRMAMNLAVGLLLMKPREEPTTAGLRSAFPSG